MSYSFYIKRVNRNGESAVKAYIKGDQVFTKDDGYMIHQVFQNIPGQGVKEIVAIYKGDRQIYGPDAAGIIYGTTTNGSMPIVLIDGNPLENVEEDPEVYHGFMAELPEEYHSIYGMFQAQTDVLTVDFSGIDASKVGQMDQAFSDCYNLVGVIFPSGSFYADTCQEMFQGCTALKSVDMSKVKMPYLESCAGMFYQCTALEDVKVFSMPEARNISGMFLHCTSLKKVDFSKCNIKKTSIISGLFRECTLLEEVDFSNAIIGNEYNDDAFRECPNLKRVHVKNCSQSTIDNLIAALEQSRAADSEEWVLSDEYIIPAPVLKGTTTDGSKPKISLNGEQQTVVTDPNVTKGWKAKAPVPLTSCAGAIASNANVDSVDLSNFDTTGVLTFTEMFGSYNSWTYIDASYMDVSSAVNMTKMFNNNLLLQELDLSGWDIKSSCDTTLMFKGANHLNIVRVAGCSDATIQKLKNQLITDQAYLSTNWKLVGDILTPGIITGTCLDDANFSINVNGSEVSVYPNNGNWTAGVVGTLTSLASCIYNNQKVISVRFAVDTTNLTNLDYAFWASMVLRTIDFTGLKLTESVSMNQTFWGCRSLSKVIVNECDDFTIEKLRDKLGTQGAGDTYEWELVEEDGDKVLIPKYNWLIVTTNNGVRPIIKFQGIETNYYYQDETDPDKWRCRAQYPLTSCYSMVSMGSNVVAVDFSEMDTSKVTNMNYAFSGQPIESLDLSPVDTSSVTEYSAMFIGLQKLKKLDCSMFDTTKAESFGSMFDYCISLEELDLSGWYVRDIVWADSRVFRDCNSLKKVKVTGCSDDTCKNLLICLNGDKAGGSDTWAKRGDYLIPCPVINFRCINAHKPVVCLNGVEVEVINRSDIGNAWKVVIPEEFTSLKNFLNGQKEIMEVEFPGTDLSTVTDFTDAFKGCESLERVHVAECSEDDIATLKARLGADQAGGVSKWNLINDYLLPASYVILTTVDGKLPGRIYIAGKTRDTEYDDEGRIIADCSDNSPVTSLSSTLTSNTKVTSIDFTNLRMGEVTSMSSFMYNVPNLKEIIGWDKIDTSHVKTMDYAFRNTGLESISFEGKDLSSVTTFKYACAYNTNLKQVSLKDCNISSASVFEYFLTNNASLLEVEWSGVSNPSGLGSLGSSSMPFYNDYALQRVHAANMSSMWSSYLPQILKSAKPGGKTFTKTGDYFLPGDKFTGSTSGATPTVKINGSNASVSLSSATWTATLPTPVTSLSKVLQNQTMVTAVYPRFDSSSVTDMSYAFDGCTGVVTGYTYLRCLIVSSVTSMNYMFRNNTALTSLNLEGWMPENVTDITGMFYNCSAFTSETYFNVKYLKFPVLMSVANAFYGMSKIPTLNLSGWYTPNLVEMGHAFQNCSAMTTLNLSGWFLEKVTGWEDTFAGCSKLTKVIVEGCTQASINLLRNKMNQQSAGGVSNWAQIDNYLAPGGLKGTTTNGSTPTVKFNNASQPVTVTANAWQVDIPDFTFTSLKSMLEGNTAVDTVELEALGYAIGNTVTDYSRIFYGCSALTTVSNWEKMDTSNATNASYAFAGMKMVPDLKKFLVSSMTNLEGCCMNNTGVTGLSLSGYTLTNLTTVKSMFEGCTSLGSVYFYNCTTPALTTMEKMFKGATGMYRADLKKWDVSSVSTFAEMFSGCTAVQTLNLSNWNMPSSAVTTNMFKGCNSLTGVEVNGCNSTTIQKLINQLNADVAYGSTMWHQVGNSIAPYDVRVVMSDSSTPVVTINNASASLVRSTIDSKTFFVRVVTPPTSLDNMFYNQSKVSVIDIGYLDTSKVTTAKSAFRVGDSSVLTQLTTGKSFPELLYADRMFSSVPNVTMWPAISDANKLKSTLAMFERCKASSIMIECTLSTVTDMSYMFNNTQAGDIALNNISLDHNPAMTNMFTSSNALYNVRAYSASASTRSKLVQRLNSDGAGQSYSWYDDSGLLKHN